MYKTILIDDENSTLKLLSKIIDWKTFGFEIAGSYNGGEEGLLLYPSVKPDLIIVDIRMSPMNGIEFIKRVREFDPIVKIVILSAYGEFEYAQKAINYGVSHFMLKPLDEEVIKEVLIDIRSKLDLESSTRNEFRKIRHELEEMNAEETFRKWFNAMDSEEREVDGDLLWSVFRQQLPDLPYCIIDMHAEPINSHLSMPPSKLIQELRQWLDSCCRKYVMIQISLYHFIIVVSCEGKEEKQTSEKLLDQFSCLTKQFDDRFDFCIGISQPLYEFNLMNEAYRQAVHASQTGFYGSGSFVRLYMTCRPFAQVFEEELYGKEERAIVKLVLLGDRDELIELLKQRISFYVREQVWPDAVYAYFLHIFSIIKKEIAEYYSDGSLILTNTETVESLKRFYTLTQLNDYIVTMIGYVWDKIVLMQGRDKNYSMAAKAKVYGEQQFRRQQLSIQEVADYLGISTSYFLRLFKDVTGNSYWNYITTLRIEESKLLLRTTSLTNFEISEMIGYGSEYHFSRKFKEKVGVSPKKYRML